LFELLPQPDLSPGPSPKRRGEKTEAGRRVSDFDRLSETKSLSPFKTSPPPLSCEEREVSPRPSFSPPRNGEGRKRDGGLGG